MGVLTSTEIIFLVVLQLVLALLALTYEVSRSRGKFTFSNVIWGVVLFGVPGLGILLYGCVKLIIWLFNNETAAA